MYGWIISDYLAGGLDVMLLDFKIWRLKDNPLEELGSLAA
jgi:hypothetical protein